MQNIKNFKRIKPTEKQLIDFATPEGVTPVFLRSEDDQDWFECQLLFEDDTVKIMYDSKGIIHSVVDAPVPERGGIYAVSMFFPEDMSVAEVAINDYPAGVQIDGSWIFYDGEISPVPTDIIGEAEKEKVQRVNEAELAIAPLLRAVKYGIATDEEKCRLESWEIYTVLLNRVEPSQAPDIQWPERPGSNTTTTS